MRWKHRVERDGERQNSTAGPGMQLVLVQSGRQ